MRKALVQPDKRAAVIRNYKAFGDDTSLKRGGASKSQLELDNDTTEFMWGSIPHISDGRVALWIYDTDDPRLTTEAEKAAMLTEDAAKAAGFYGPEPFKPKIVTFSPANNATDVDAALNLVALFDSPITFGVGSVHLYDGADQHIASLTAPGHVGTGGGTMHIVGTDLIMDLTNNMLAGERYYILMDASLIVGFAGISDKLVWNWKIALAPVTRKTK